MEYAIVHRAVEREFVDTINRLLTEGWQLEGDLLCTPHAFVREMVRYAIDPERAQLAEQIADAVKDMSLGAAFTFRAAGGQFELKRVK